MFPSVIDADVRARLERLEIPFNSYGLDPWGISKTYLGFFYSMLGFLYRHYFRVTTYGIEHVPPRGRALVIGNHSGSLPVDGGMVLASLFFECEPPRHGHGMVEKFAQYFPFVSTLFNRSGQLTGLPEHAIRLLEDERLLMVFPEGARGTGKLYKDRYQLVRFGTGFVRIALRTHSPIVPFAFIGGEEALPAVYHSRILARLAGTPYWPVPLHILPVPLPVRCEIHYGEALHFEGDGRESDDIIEGYVTQVKEAVNRLVATGLAIRKRGERALRAQGAAA